MTPKLEAKIVAGEAKLRRLLGKVGIDDVEYRLIDIDPLAKLASHSEEFAGIYRKFVEHYRYGVFVDDLHAMIALKQIEDELIELSIKMLKGDDQILGLERLRQMRETLMRRLGISAEMPEAMADVLKTAPRRTLHNDDVLREEVDIALDEVWHKGANGGFGVKDAEIFKKLAEGIDLGNPAIRDEIVEILLPILKDKNFKKKAIRLNARGKLVLDNTEFREKFRGLINALKGKIVEVWFYNTLIWKTIIKKRYVTKANLLARELNAMPGGQFPFKVRVVETVARDAGGREIYDGMVLVVRQKNAADPNSLEGFLVASVQIKSDLRLTRLIEQTGNDFIRENLGKAHTVTTKIRGVETSIEILSDAETVPIRVVVAPDATTKRLFEEMLIPGQVEAYVPAISPRESDRFVQHIIVQLAKSHISG